MSTLIDFAKAQNRDRWLHHYAIGDPSWDTFKRETGNPIYQGKSPYEWPVNGFLFRDPVSGQWYAYVGLYPRGYWPGGPCLVMRERPTGGWEEIGLAIQGDAGMFDGDGRSPGAMPDVSVVYSGGRYHMIYDWANPQNTRGGIAYAWANKPEGPFTRADIPIHEDTFQQPILGQYVRAYAATLIKRAHDWIILHDMSTTGNAGGTWAMACMTSSNPDGPYSKPTLLLYPQCSKYLPPSMEYYPAFEHDGFIYAPATSVALNRTYQCVFRAPTEQAHRPDAWNLFQHGSVWHAENDATEAQGIWGQTFSAQVDPQMTLRAYFTSKTRNDVGTVHLARREWHKPYHDGFVLSAPNAPAYSILRAQYREFACRIRATANGRWSVGWQCQAPLGPDTAAWNPQAHALMRTQRVELQIDIARWLLATVDQDGVVKTVSQGGRAASTHAVLDIRRSEDRFAVFLDGLRICLVTAQAYNGRLELIAEAGTRLEIHSFDVDGNVVIGTEFWLPTEALAGAATGMNQQDWAPVLDDRFRYNIGFQSVRSGARAKWNYYGAGFKLHAPRKPAYGKGRVRVDGEIYGEVDFHAPTEQPSSVVGGMTLPIGYHAVAIEAIDGTIPCDCLEVWQS